MANKIMKIDADELPLRKLLEGKKEIFQVPNYQRRYSWGQEQWNDLWNDLESISKDDIHFLGSIVVITKEHELADFNELELVDGQQRLATILIMLRVVREFLVNTDKKREAKEMKDYMYSGNFEREKLKVRLGVLDQEDFKDLMEGRIKEIDNPHLENAYNFFKNKIKDKSYKQIQRLKEEILFQISVVLITTDSNRSAFRLFETLNDRGLELSAIDLMKNYILRVVSEKNNIEIKHIKNDWEKIITNLKDVDKKIRFFRHYFMSAKKPEIKQKITQGKVYDQFKKIIDEELTRVGMSIENYIKDMRKQSKVYANICDANVQRYDNSSTNEEINFRLRNLNDMGAIPARTLLLRLFREDLEAEKVIEILKLVEIFSIRRMIGRLPTGELDRIYNQLAVSAFKEEKPVDFVRSTFSENITSDEVFRENFLERSYRLNDLTKYLLDTIERRHYMKMGSGKNIADRSDVHIEHIAPRGAFSSKKYKEWKKCFEIDEEEFSEIKDLIGNLTLFEKKLNIKASDRPFEQKREIYRDETDFIMAEEVCNNYEKWTADQIKERSKKMAKIATEIWSLENLNV